MMEWITRGKVEAGWTTKLATMPSEFSMALHTAHPPKDILHNRHTLAHEIDRPLRQFVAAQQTHSCNVTKITASDVGKGATSYDTAIPNCDALYTTEPNIVLTTFVADCVPILLYSERHSIISAIHSGWKGTVQNIVGTTCHTICKRERVTLESFYAWVGPSISQRAFEVDEDVYAQFAQMEGTEPYIQYDASRHKWHIHTKAIVVQQLQKAGIALDHITVDHRCTYEDANSFSYREDRACGRHLAFIVQS